MQMIGQKKGVMGVGSAQFGKKLTLDNMDLDRREEFSGDAFNPFGASQM